MRIYGKHTINKEICQKMSENTTTQTAETKILENIANPTQSYEVDGEKTTLKDPVKQLDALDRLKAARASRNPAAAIMAFHFQGGSGER